ncbi:MAG: hypothetical protein AAF708_19740 [Deinococcota bacterium]
MYVTKMLQNNFLKTLTLTSDWDFPLVNKLMSLSLISCENGYWEGLQEETLCLLELLDKTHKKMNKPLRTAFNDWVKVRKIYEFDSEDEESLEELIAAELALANKILEYHADPEIYIIVHVVDEVYYDEAWLLCFLSDIQELDLDTSIVA